MHRRMPAFLKYLIVGTFNTAIHGVVFAAMQLAGNDQALSNLVAFMVALSFSYLQGARFVHALLRIRGGDGQPQCVTGMPRRQPRLATAVDRRAVLPGQPVAGLCICAMGLHGEA